MADPLTYEEHRELGSELLKTRGRLLRLASVVTAVYGQHSQSAFTFQKVNNAIDRLCREMQMQAETDCPGLNASSFYK